MVCVWGGGSQAPPGWNSTDSPPRACSDVFCPMVMTGWAEVSFPRQRGALSVRPMFTLTFLPVFLSLASLMSPGLGLEEEAIGPWSFTTFLQMGSWNSDFPFYPLAVVIFKGLFASSGTSFYRCGQILGVDTPSEPRVPKLKKGGSWSRNRALQSRPG